MRVLVVVASRHGSTQELAQAMGQALQALAAQLRSLSDQIGVLERGIHAQHRASEASRRLETIPSIGALKLNTRSNFSFGFA